MSAPVIVGDREALRRKFPGFNYFAPNPEITVRPRGRVERLCAYRARPTITSVHFHTMAELTLVLEGSGDLRIGGRRYPIRPGLFALAPSNVLHGQHSPGPISKLVCMFDPGLVGTALAGDPFNGQLRLVGRQLPHAAELDPAGLRAVIDGFDELLDEHAHPERPGSATMVATLLAQLLTRFLRAVLSGQVSGRQPAADEDGPEEDLVRVLDYVQEHFTEPINRATVAQALGMRPEAISRLFRRGAGESFSSLLQRLRLGHAVELFESTALGPAEIRQLCGFDSYRTFARVFRSAVGVSPKEYRTAQL